MVRKKTSKIVKKKSNIVIKKPLKLNYEHKRRDVELHMDHFLYGISLLILMFCNFLGVLLLLPFLLVFEGTQLYLVVFLFAIMFGLLFNYLIMALSHLGDKHHIIAGVVIPILAIIDILVMLELMEMLIERFRFFPTFDPYVVVVLFIAAFLIPYIFDLFRGKHKI